MKTEKIIIRGEKQTAPVSNTSDMLQLDASYVVTTSSRGGLEKHEVLLNDDSVVEFVFEDDTVWLCSPNTIDELFPETTAANRSATDGVEIPLYLSDADVERGLLGNVILKIVNIFSKKKLTKAIGALAEDLEKKQLQDQIGLFRIDKVFQLQKFTGEASTSPYLLFIHGTANSLKGTFGGFQESAHWELIHQSYEGRIIGFQHETLTKGPLENVLDLIKVLPKNSVLHLVTQSHGGHVGDLLSRFCNQDENNLGFSEAEINLLKKEKRDEDVQTILAIRKEVKGKGLRIDKFVRVACPAGGSTLASKRLDHLLNVLLNLIGIGTGGVGSAILGAFKNLIAAVLESKNDVNILPGIESLNPKSPFITVLNNPESSIDNSLIIIAGNCKMKINLRALLVIATKLFFGQKNDIVVDTKSMYSGTPRKGLVQYFLDEGTEVDHFHYFKNKRTQDAIGNAILSKEGQIIADFNVLERDLLDAQRGIFGLEGGQVFQDTVTGTKPILVLLPGIMGSNLSQNERMVWINYLGFLGGNLKKLEITSKGIEAPSLIKTSYGKLAKHFSSSYDVITFPFDWRLQLATRAKLFSNKIDELLKYNQPIKIIGHSMGGVLVRDFIVNNPKTWNKLNQSSGFKLIFLGAPLGGSYRIPSVLFGHDSIINTLGKIDLRHSKKELLNIFSKLPGILSLLPHSKDHDFSIPQTWAEMKSACGQPDWPLPSTVDLQEFGSYRDNIKDNLEDIDYTNVTYIAGRDKATPCGFRIDDSKNGKELVFLSTAEGDQSVTWESGIPARMIKENSVYYVNVTHGGLANEPDIFDGISEILTNGSTHLLSKVRPAVRSEQKLFRSPEIVEYDLSPDNVERSLLGLNTTVEKSTSLTSPLKISVTNGDLKYATYPLIAGHFNNDGILYAEKVIDIYLKGALSERHTLGLYPGAVGSNEVLLSPGDDFKGAVIIGLGDVGGLTAFLLTKSVEQGAAKYLIQLNTLSSGNSDVNGISSLIIGCGYGGLSIEDSANAIITGVSNANEKIKRLYRERAKLIECIEFIEQDKRKALNCFYALHKLEKNSDQNYLAVLGKKVIAQKPGAFENTSTDQTAGWWTRLTVQHQGSDTDENKVDNLLFNISTGGAREEQRLLPTSSELIDDLINEISTENSWSASKAKTIFELLIPNDFKDQVKKQNNITWVVDNHTASYPWELLQDNVENAKPLSVTAGMIRQLATQDYRTRINAVTNKKALVIGDPDLNGMIGQLPGAFKEGQMASSIFSSQGFETTTMLRSSSGKIIEALFSADYKIIHLAGHGIYNPKSPGSSGMVIGHNLFLSTRQISQMSSVPEFVFVNCCYLGKIDGGDQQLYKNRSKLAANIGTQLIQNGVKAVIAAGWAVDDAAALEFTEVFYKAMFNGYMFGDAVKKARVALYAKSNIMNNTWGAYQCYGDPYYKFQEVDFGGNRKYDFITTGESLIALSNLHSEIETANSTKENYVGRLQNICKEIDQANLRDFNVTEKEAMIYADLYEYDLSIAKFEALKAGGNSFSFPGMERYCSLRVKKSVLNYATNPKKVKIYLRQIDEVVEDLKGLLRLGATSNRYAGLGATYKRKSLLLNSITQKVNAYAQMTLYYQKAYASSNNPYAANSLSSWIEGEHILILLGKRKWGDEIKTSGRVAYRLPLSVQHAEDQLNKMKTGLMSMSPEKMDYRDLVGIASIELCLSLLHPRTASFPDVLILYKRIWTRAGSQGKKSSEIEHFDFLIDAYQQIAKNKIPGTITLLTSLKNELTKLI